MRRIVLTALVLASPSFAQPVVQSEREKARYDGCVNAIPTDAAKAEQFAAEWQALGGGLPARHCLGLAQVALGKPALAATTFARAAQAAEAAKVPFAADLWAQAGNAALLAGDGKGALAHLNSAISGAGNFQPKRLASFHLDRARAAVETGDAKLARADLDRAKILDGSNADAWLLSATLARREKNLDLAATDIDAALKLQPKDADTLLEAGRIALLVGERGSARAAWSAVLKNQPGSDAARQAQALLSANP